MPTTTADVPANLVVEFDLHDQALAATSHDVLRAVREIGPVTWTHHTAATGWSLATKSPGTS